MSEPARAPSVACSWCGRSIYEAGGRWLATKGKERGYDPLPCDANDEDGKHEPDEALRPKSEWTASDWIVEAICFTVGCRSWLGRPWALGYRLVCNPLCLWLWRREDRKEAKQRGPRTPAGGEG